LKGSRSGISSPLLENNFSFTAYVLEYSGLIWLNVKVGRK
jgi:hypothetical protein